MAANLIRSVEIEFENLDYVNIPKEYIDSMIMNEISFSINNYHTNALLKNYCAKSLYLRVSKSFRCLPGSDDSDIFEPFDKRIMHRDIAYLRIHYSNGSYEDIYVPWKDDGADEYNNRLQHCSTDEDGNFVVEIHED